MGSNTHDRGGFGILGAARRVLRSGVNAPRSGLRPISEDHALTGLGNERLGDPEKEGYAPSGTTSTPPKDTQRDEEAEDRDRRRQVRTIPPWVHSFEEGEDDTEQDSRSYLLPNIPADIRTPQHHYVPEPKPNAAKGRKYDQYREWRTVTANRPLALRASHWQSFTPDALAPRMPAEPGVLVNEEWQRQNEKDLTGPWNPAGMGNAAEGAKGFWLFSRERRLATMKNTHRTLMQNSFILLILRLTIMIFVLASLAVSATIFQHTDSLNGSPLHRVGVDSSPESNPDSVCQQQPSTYLAIVVGSIAVVYTLYIAWDEFTSKPLGLRSSSDKIRLLFLDPVLFVFAAANTSIAFNTYLDRQWACFHNGPQNQNNQQAAQSTCIYDGDLCNRQQTLAGLLIIVLVLWMLTFAISVLRVVERTAR